MTKRFEAALFELDDYVRGRGTDAELAPYEEDLFERALQDRAPELAFHAGVGAALRALQARGTLDLWRTAREVEQLRASGARVMLFEPGPANPSVPVIPEDVEVLVTRVPLDLSSVRKLEAEICTADGRVLKRMPDIPFDPADGAVYACCEPDLARASAQARTITRVFAVDEAGRRLLVELR